MFGLLGTIIIGFFAGLLARAIHPGDDKLGFVMTVILGIVGSLVANLLGSLLNIYESGDKASFISSVIGAVILLSIYSYVQKKGLINKKDNIS